jgi:hypothetical protein
MPKHDIKIETTSVFGHWQRREWKQVACTKSTSFFVFFEQLDAPCSGAKGGKVEVWISQSATSGQRQATR